jgi:hypothetical protein
VNPYSRLARDEPTECRDLHKIMRDDGRPLLPLDHWGLGCPFTLLELESRLGPNPLPPGDATTDELDLSGDEKGETQ